MRKRTLLFKIWKFPQFSETFIVNQILLAVKMGYEVKILIGELTDISKNANRKLFEEYNLREKIIIEDYKISPLKSKRILKAAWLLIKNIFLLPQLIKYYNNSTKKGLLPLYEFFFYKPLRNFDVIHIQFGTNKHPVDIMKKTGYLKSRVIVSFHGHDLYFPINNRIPNNGYYDRLFEVADYLVANTPFLKEKLLALNAPEAKIEIIPVAVDTSIFKPYMGKDKHEKLRLVTVGRLDELKGQEYGIRTVNLLLKKGYSVDYTIAGSGVDEVKLTNLIKNLDLTSNVFLKGRVSPEEVSRLLQNSDIFLMTSVTNSAGMEESQGLVTAEAQACGLPVVAFGTGGVKYTLIDGKTGFLCNEKDIDCYTNKIELLIRNESLRKKMSVNALRFIEKEYSENSVLNKWRTIYD
jgi:colanic acid/amylovoran biosynthesis glycosyltransferase